MIHGYYGRAVYLTGDETSNVDFRDDGYVILNPQWFYERFSDTAEDHIEKMLKQQANGKLRKNGLKFVEKLIKSEPIDK